MTSPSPSQFGSNIYGQPGNLALQQQRSLSGMPTAPFQRTVTPTSMAPTGFPMGLQQQQQQQQQQAQQPSQQISPNRNMFPMTSRGILSTLPGQLATQMKRPNPVSSALLSSSTSTGLAALSGAFGRPSMVSKPSQEPTPEFQIQQEDFPALPGAQNPPTSGSSEISRKQDPFPATSTAGNNQFDQALKDKFTMDKTGNGPQKRGIQTHPDGMVSNIPPEMVTDQFGMVGLLTFIRAAETDPNLVALAPGIDLTTLGLNLNSPEHLYNTFLSPLQDATCRPQDIDFHVPTEYVTNLYIRDKLAPIKLNRYGEDLLFFLFYMNGGDVLQLAAAAELYNRDWRFYKEERVWITRAPGMEPVVKTSTYERGTYYYFDAQNWRKIPKEFYLEYDKLEERPQLPPMQQE